MRAREQWHPDTIAASDDHNYFPTEDLITRNVVRAELSHLQQFPRVWECCAGGGAMVRVLRESGLHVVATDLIDRGCGRGGVDFLSCQRPRSQCIFTNPPYEDDLPEKFIRHARDIGIEYLGMLLKVQFWNTQGRTELWRTHRPAREYRIAWRPDFTGAGGGMLDVAFFVWDFRAMTRDTSLHLITKQGDVL